MDIFRQYTAYDFPEERGSRSKVFVLWAVFVFMVIIIFLMIAFHPFIAFSASAHETGQGNIIAVGARNVGSFDDSTAVFRFSTSPDILCTTSHSKNCITQLDAKSAVCGVFTLQDSISYICPMEETESATFTLDMESRYQNSFHQFHCTKSVCTEITQSARGSFPVLYNYLFLYPFDILGII